MRIGAILSPSWRDSDFCFVCWLCRCYQFKLLAPCKRLMPQHATAAISLMLTGSGVGCRDSHEAAAMISDRGVTRDVHSEIQLRANVQYSQGRILRSSCAIRGSMVSRLRTSRRQPFKIIVLLCPVDPTPSYIKVTGCPKRQLYEPLAGWPPVPKGAGNVIREQGPLKKNLDSTGSYV